jgi:membrane protease YdiL (CAAX protease family)
LLVDREGRLRTGWRLLVFGAMTMLIQTGLVLVLAVFADPRRLLQSSLSSMDPLSLVSHGIGIVVATAAVYFSRRWLDHRSFASLGVELHPGWRLHLVVGALLGIVLQAAIFVIELAMGWLVVESVGWRGGSGGWVGLTVMLVAFLAVAWNEELVVRGYVLQNLEHGLGIKLAVLISSVAFGALHVFNSNSSAVAVVGVSVAGLLLAVAYLVTRTLWLAVGLHLGWNYGEGPIFGFPVSGLDAGGLITHRVIGPEAFTGGAFGPEAGLVSVAVELVGIGVLVLWWRRRARTGVVN